jgi:hypothetical protein
VIGAGHGGAPRTASRRAVREISDLVCVLEDWKAQQDSEPIFDVDMHKVDGKPFVRVTFPDGKEETIYGFNDRAEAIKWTRCEAVVWLYNRRKELDRKKA